MKWFLSAIAVIAIAAAVVLIWSPWNDSSDSSVMRARGNVQMIYQRHPPRNVTYVYAGRGRWIDANSFGGLRRKGRVIHAKLVSRRGKEKVIRGSVIYEDPGSLKRRSIKWNGKRAIHLHRKLKLVKGGKKHKVVLKQAYLFVYKHSYLLPPRPVKGS